MRNRWGQSLAPLALRCVLGLTLLWAGLGKIEGEFVVQGDTAATLASMGVDRLREEGQKNLRGVPPPALPAPALPSPAATPPVNTQPADGPVIVPTVPGPTVPTPTTPAPVTPTPAQPTPAQPQPNPPTPEPVPEPAPVIDPLSPRAAAHRSMFPAAKFPAAMPTLAQVTAPPATPDPSSMAGKGEVVYHAGLFPQPVSIKRLYRVSLLMYRAGNPVAPPATSAVASPNSSPVAIANAAPRKLLPSFLTRSSRPVAFAWVLAIGEVIAGVLLLIGLLTRVAAVWAIGLMLGAIWLTELGPAIQTGNTLLGFLPKRDMWEPEAWKTLFWQCSLLGTAIALACTGCGWLGLDKRLFPQTPPTPARPRPMM